MVALFVVLRIYNFDLYWFSDTFFANPGEPLPPNSGNGVGVGNAPMGFTAKIVAELLCCFA